MGSIAISPDTSRNRLYIGIGIVALAVVAMTVKPSIENLLGLDLNDDGVVGDPNDPEECIAVRSAIESIDSDIKFYRDQLAITTNPAADIFIRTRIAALEVEKKYLEYVYGCTSPFGNH